MRLKPPAQGASALNHPAPADVLPAELAELIAEHQRLITQRDDYASQNSALRLHRREDDAEARRADAAAAVAAVRNGQDEPAAIHTEALRQRREDVAHRLASLNEALDQVEREIQSATYAWVLTGEPAKTADRAADKLAKAAAAFAKALEEASAARAVVEWADGVPYEPTALVRLLDLDPSLSRLLGQAGNDLPAAVDALSAIHAITATLVKETIHV
jgi:hypothetical protein